MSTIEKATLHVLPPSHPCMTAEAGLRHKGIEYEKVTLDMGRHGDQIEAIYGEGNRTVPGLSIGDERIHGSVPIMNRLEELVPDNPLYPKPIAEKVSEAERWADGDLQDLGRRLPWGALHFRPEAMGTLAGGESLDPAGTDFAIKFVRASWKYHSLTAVQLAEDLVALPGMIDRIETFAADGIIDGEDPTAADFQIGATIRVLLTVEDLHPVISGSAAERIARRHFPDYPGLVPAGAFPDGWVK
ncbi:MAG: glutathione S-transferase [Actinomycetota bacterium]|nr:glutathione S-transferase [Actinomycetota bacterium]